MAKEIKVIQCPKCGSVDKTEIKPDHYKCNACATEYFLDSNDININHNIRYDNNNNKNTAAAGTNPNVKKILVLIFAGLFSISIFSRLFSTCSKHRNTSEAYTAGEAGSGGSNEAEEYSLWHSAKRLYADKENNAILFMVAQRDYRGGNSDAKTGVYASFTDAVTGKELKSRKLDNISIKGNLDLATRQFENGDIYFIANKMLLFKIDKESHTVEDVTGNFAQNQPQLSSGIANIEFVYEHYGDGFNILTNDGKMVYYYPIAGKAYSKTEFGDIRQRSSMLNGPERTAYTFSSASSDYPEEKIQLVKYIYKGSNGGPREEPSFQWRDDYGGSGIFTDRDPHRKVFLPDYSKKEAGIISYTDLTPERLYFDPKLLYFDKDYVLISFKTTAAENAPTSIQCINGTTGGVVFTTPLEEKKYMADAIRYKNGFAVNTNLESYIIGMDGKIIATHKER